MNTLIRHRNNQLRTLYLYEPLRLESALLPQHHTQELQRQRQQSTESHRATWQTVYKIKILEGVFY